MHLFRLADKEGSLPLWHADKAGEEVMADAVGWMEGHKVPGESTTNIVAGSDCGLHSQTEVEYRCWGPRRVDERW